MAEATRQSDEGQKQMLIRRVDALDLLGVSVDRLVRMVKAGDIHETQSLVDRRVRLYDRAEVEAKARELQAYRQFKGKKRAPNKQKEAVS